MSKIKNDSPCSANQWTDFYMITAPVMKGLSAFKDILIFEHGFLLNFYPQRENTFPKATLKRLEHKPIDEVLAYSLLTLNRYIHKCHCTNCGHVHIY